ncbi:MAG: hypothetical protein QOG94_2312 [Solirubrobacteraceae bacterium]|nr:hypothetical protein [Solirubrobacteraceae bacterium]
MDVDDLYGLPFDRFVAERGALAKALRSARERERAAQVAALRKPSVAAWAVNQLVRTQHDAVAELYAAGDALRDAQADLLAGRGDGRALRAAGEAERAAVQRLVETARGLLTSDGHELSETVVERVADTLHAAALDEHAREQVREGRLERELRHVGLGLGEAPAPAAGSAPKRAAGAKGSAPKRAAAEASARAKAEAEGGAAKAKAKAKGGAAKGEGEAKGTADGKAAAKPSADERAAERAARRERAAAERAEEERAQRERDEARRAARTAESAARRRAERAARALANAEERHDRAAQALAAAEQELADAREEAAEAAAAHERAQAELSGI